MYFSGFSKGYYDIKNDGNFKLVTEINTRIKVGADISDDVFMYTKFDVMSGDSPEDVSQYHFGSPNYHWIILLTNFIRDRYTEWPMDPITYEKYLTDKYSNVNAVHHYEIDKTSGDTTAKGPADYSNKIEVSSDISGATEVSNLEYENRLQDKYRQIKLLNSNLLLPFLKEYDRIMNS
tara:strand:+ start:607 stop:1140 length:534 start_codon:yes stop_codon:yes gene_type:complete